MADNFKKLMRQQIQERFKAYEEAGQKPTPPQGWIKTIREALGMSSQVLAKRMGKSRSNVTSMEQSEQRKTISLKSLEQIAQALNCKLVYCLVPIEPLDKILESQARKVAQKRIALINHSMKLEQQGLTAQQLKQQEDDLVQALLFGSPKKIWNNRENEFARS